MQTLNYSRQREAIMRFLKARKDHPTAEVIYDEVKKELPNISLGTVYRNLKLLSETNQIKRITADETQDHFDADISVHQHFICQGCGCVQDIYIKDDSLLEKIDLEASRNFDGKINSNDIYFFGMCHECADKK